jgi:hypothetical protein
VQRHFSVSKRRQSRRRRKGTSPSAVADHALQLNYSRLRATHVHRRASRRCRELGG